MKLSYSVERSPLGTGGAIALGMEKVEEDEVFIINGDTFFNINLKEFREFHIKQNRKISLALKPMVNFDRYGKVELDNTNRIIKFFEKQSTSKGLINAGIYFADKNLTRLFPRTKKFSFEKDFLEMKLDKLNVGGYVADKYFIDIGIPDDFNRAQTELLSF
jgi:D-glycero-alpha-D-manno-heptose 1-phosphate guanylyltransferase